ncbi:hypothetical protein conserved [Leishmania donovani]|uniref:Hypothetical_protein_conserved n=1 Tax=Leishmania donovani TaxID=5661 RepID=A0A6J8F599_LEIDO|nr:hypothetical protein conserved [Leishmania donovani]VDZ42567.1 hypothetical_protein_conserved [Leishmania donovani]
MSGTPAVGARENLGSRVDVGRSPSETSGRDGQVAHLLAQIAFLHREVERLEQLLSTVRAKSYADARELTSQYEQTIKQKNAELENLRHPSGSRSEVGDASKRCKVLEKQLAAANSEKSVACMERADLQAKLRKMQALLKCRKEEVVKVKGSLEESNVERSSTIAALKMTVETLSQECDRLSSELAEQAKRQRVERTSTGTVCELHRSESESQTSPIERMSQSCQVCTLQDALLTAGEDAEAPHSLAILFEEKTRECDQLRGALEDLSAMQRDALAMLEVTKNQLSTEAERRRIAVDDVENLSVQLRALQQRCSDQTAAERAMADKIRLLGEERQKMLVEKSQIERDRDHWEEQLRQYEADVAQLSATKNHSNRQLSTLANENENLRAEIQQLCEREAQAVYAVKAKDMEVQEILSAYQKAAQENESLLESQRFLERELDNVRAGLASKEETVAYLQEQLRSMHLREQQLTLDIQSLEYENENHHQRLARGDHQAAELEAKCSELVQLLQTKERCIEELHQSLSELSKQVIVKDNESLLLRQRCDTLLADMALLQASFSKEKTRVQDLEASNARLVAREVLSLNDAADRREQAQALEDERATLKAVIDENERIAVSCEQLVESNKVLESRVAELEKSLQESIEAKERLHRIVLEQNKALSRLSE